MTRDRAIHWSKIAALFGGGAALMTLLRGKRGWTAFGGNLALLVLVAVPLAMLLRDRRNESPLRREF